MKYHLKYSPEMTTKSRIVRTRFCKQLRKNLARILREQLDLRDLAAFPDDPDAALIEAHWDYLELALPPSRAALVDDVEAVLRSTPGIWSFQRVEERPLGGFDDMVALAAQVCGSELNGKTFVVRCRRSGKHPFNSMDVERYVGGGLLRVTGAKGVDLRTPEVTVRLEIRQDKLYIGGEPQDGIGGFPLGTQDAVLSLISGGFDSAVASFLAMKRGLRTHFLFFNLGGREHELAVKEVALFLWQRYGASHGVEFISVPFEAVVAEILERIENSQMGVVLKRMMLRAATQVADKLEIPALVTGEAIAQVSSQTLINLAIIDEVTPKLVLRPLAMSDKQDIVDLARKIGTAEFSAVIPEYCGVISVKPTTRAKRHRIEREENRFNFAVLEQAVAEAQSYDIRRLSQEDLTPALTPDETAQVDAQAAVIDIRHPDEEERKPLQVPGATVLKIPFYKLSSAFATLDPSRHYLLYCAKGVMSRLHAAHLLEQGKSNVGVYRP
ncbi:MAG: tRNA 4-thiouridine(8) synthase ThiI [Pseudomonadales bacterium]|jgi:thiamine biosynthesis protein ThiI|nr:tRNA 4-thiouridine(8) synthase ThiI [Pseudomonadales bacterium]